MKTFPFGLFLMGHISVFQLNDPKSMNFFYNFRIFCISCDKLVLNDYYIIRHQFRAGVAGVADAAGVAWVAGFAGVTGVAVVTVTLATPATLVLF